jgi:hypothetical protein
MNVSFDSVPNDDEDSKNLPPASGLNGNSVIVCDHHGVLGSLVKDKSKEHLLNGIMQQASWEGLILFVFILYFARQYNYYYNYLLFHKKNILIIRIIMLSLLISKTSMSTYTSPKDKLATMEDERLAKR